MPRQRRLLLPEVAAHIIQRGNNKGAVFLGDSDYLAYLHHLRDLAAKLDCRVHAYCLMTNHVHLLVTPPSLEACISLMRNLGQRYAQYFNRCHARTGTLWEGRFKSCVVESAAYVLACYRYIELNPVRAGMVSTPDAYQWSSHCANAGTRADTLVSAHTEYLALGTEPSSRLIAYRGLFETELAPSLLRSIRESTSAGYPLASESFKDLVAGTNRKIGPGRSGRPPKKADGPRDEAQRDLLTETGL